MLILFSSCSLFDRDGGGLVIGERNKVNRLRNSYEEGDLIGAYPGISYESSTPLGSVFIPSNSIILGMSGGDEYGLSDNSLGVKTVSITALFVDETEITNSQYRKFYKVVEDDILREALAEKVEELIISGVQLESGSILDYSYIKQDTSLPYYKFIINNKEEKESKKILNELDYFTDLPRDPLKYKDVYYAEVLDNFFIFDEHGERIFDKEKVYYVYEYVDIGKLMGRNIENMKKQDYLKIEKLKISPDESVWLKDFSYSYNDPIMKDYFNHFTFDDYPVVGVNWNQARAFCAWRTDYKDRYNRKVGLLNVSDFRLPSEVEWEYVSRGQHQSGIYPWGGNYLVNEKGEYLANFKPLRGNYIEDGHLYTSQVKSFKPNDYGIYDMSGNVSEWTNTTYREDGYNFYSTITPEYINYDDNRIVVKGGSWKDVAYFLQVFVRDYEFKGESRSYIGFRTVQEYQGEKIGKVELEVYYDY